MMSKDTIIIKMQYGCGHKRNETVLVIDDYRKKYDMMASESVCPECQVKVKHSALGQNIYI
jgi:hypothetical protein